MKNKLFNYNGDVFWESKEIEFRHFIVNQVKDCLERSLRDQNNAFRFFQIESPILTPLSKIIDGYRDECFIADTYALRPETTMGSYAYIEHLLVDKAQKLPFCVWQCGKSFRKEQDQPLTKMKLKEFYQLEFQMIYSESTKCDYSIKAIEAVKEFLCSILDDVTEEPSDRLPDYSESTTDLISNGMEIASISKRKDFQHPVLEFAFGLDRIVYQHFNRRNN